MGIGLRIEWNMLYAPTTATDTINTTSTFFVTDSIDLSRVLKYLFYHIKVPKCSLAITHFRAISYVVFISKT